MNFVGKIFKFRGGVEVEGRKELSSGCPLERAPRPGRLVVSMAQHRGVPAVPGVLPGEHVAKFQKIADAAGKVSSPIHAPHAGVVKAVVASATASTRVADAIVLDLDPEDGVPDASLKPIENWAEVPAAELLGRIRDAGVVGAGGAGFPTYMKLAPVAGRTIDTVIVNGAECEPYLNGDNRLMIERASELWIGALILRRVTGARRVVFAVEDNKPKAIAALEAALAGTDGEIAVLPHAYPQGSEKHIVYSVTGRKIPYGKLPADVGCIVENIWTTLTVHRAILRGEPVTVRTITVSGEAIARPANFAAPIGMSVRDLVDAAGGFRFPPAKAICGGPMMGVAMPSLDVPITKTTSGLVFLGGGDAFEFSSSPCINCGRCVEACPMGLVPSEISQAVESGDIPLAGRLHVESCFECGCCAYVCPARRPLVQHNQRAKAILAARRAVAFRKEDGGK